MKFSLFTKFSYVIISFSLATFFAIQTKEQKNVQLYLSQQEVNEIVRHANVDYVYLGSELTDIRQVVQQISDIYDETQKIDDLREHMNDGYKIERRDVITKILVDAFSLLGDDFKSEMLKVQLRDIIEKLERNKLSIQIMQRHVEKKGALKKEDTTIFSYLLQVQGIPIIVKEEEVVRDPVVEKIDGCLEVTNDAFIARNMTVGNDLVVKNDIVVCGSLIIKDKKDKVEIDGKVEFKKDVKFKKNVEIDDNLTVGDTIKARDGLIVSGRSEFKKKAKFKKDVEIEGKLTVKDDLIAKDDLEVCGKAQFKKNVNMLQNLTVQDDLVVCGDTELKGNTKVGNNLTVQEELIVCGDTIFKDDIEVNGDVFVLVLLLMHVILHFFRVRILVHLMHIALKDHVVHNRTHIFQPLKYHIVDLDKGAVRRAVQIKRQFLFD